MKHIISLIVFSVILLSCSFTTPIPTTLPNIRKAFTQVAVVAKPNNPEMCPQDDKDCRSPLVFGSGFVISSRPGRSIIVTAGHVCNLDDDPRLRILIEVYDAYEEIVLITQHSEFKAKVLEINEKLDICILQTEKDNLPTIKLTSQEPQMGERVFSISAPGGIYNKDLMLSFEGTYIGKGAPNKFYEYTDKRWYNIIGKGGSSGAPILNIRGELVGIISWTPAAAGRDGFSPYVLSMPTAKIYSYLKERLKHVR